MVNPWPGGRCRPCEHGRHDECLGWPTDPSAYLFCGCTAGACGDRLRAPSPEGDPDAPDQPR